MLRQQLADRDGLSAGSLAERESGAGAQSGRVGKSEARSDSRADLGPDRRTASKPPTAVASTGRRRQGVTKRRCAPPLGSGPKILM